MSTVRQTNKITKYIYNTKKKLLDEIMTNTKKKKLN